jgi:hypothetical protein
MSNELTTTAYLTCSNGNYSDQFQVSAQFNQNNQGASAGIATVTTGPTALPGSVSTNGWLAMRSLATGGTGIVQYGPTVTGGLQLFGNIQPGEWSVLRLAPGISLSWQATSVVTGGTILVQYLLLNN